MAGVDNASASLIARFPAPVDGVPVKPEGVARVALPGHASSVLAVADDAPFLWLVRDRLERVAGLRPAFTHCRMLVSRRSPMKVERTKDGVVRYTVHAAAAVTAAVVCLGTTPAVASHIQTPEDLRLACETSPGHVVTLNESTAIKGEEGSSSLPVASGCTIVLGAGAKLETEFLRVSFAGPLIIHSTSTTAVVLVKTRLAAPSLSIALSALDSAVASTQSALEATAGNLTITFGANSKLEMVQQLAGPAYGLAASGLVQISSYSGFQGLIYEANIFAGLGFRYTQTILGTGPTLSMGKVILDAPMGGASIVTAAGNAKLDVAESNFRVRDGVFISLEGRWSYIGLKQVAIGGWNGVTAPGGVTIAAAPTQPEGVVSLSEVSMFDVASATVLASAMGSVTPTPPRFGVITIEKSLLGPDFDLRVETGRDSNVVVKDSQLASNSLIRLAVGTGASTCLHEGNTISGQPVLQLCQ